MRNSVGIEISVANYLVSAGTVNLITFVVEFIAGDQINIKEAAPGNRESCWSVFLNRGFTRKRTELCGDDPAWNENISAKVEEKFEDLIKVRFDGVTDMVVRVLF